MLTDAIKIFEQSTDQQGGAEPFMINNHDCGINIKADGSIKFFQVGFDVGALMKAVDNPSPAEKQLLVNVEALTVILAVLANPEMRAAVLRTLRDNGSIDIGSINGN